MGSAGRDEGDETEEGGMGKTALEGGRPGPWKSRRRWRNVDDAEWSREVSSIIRQNMLISALIINYWTIKTLDSDELDHHNTDPQCVPRSGPSAGSALHLHLTRDKTPCDVDRI